MGLKEALQKLHKKIYCRNYTCYLCQAEVFKGEAFCADCRKTLPYNTSYCTRCGREIPQIGYCMDCRTQMPPFDKARSVFVYKGEAIRLIYAFKNGNPTFAEGFASEALPIVKREFFDADFITFVPMSDRAQKERGYNQSALFARSMSELSGIPVEDVFEKRRDTPEQKSLSRTERQNNLQGVFHLKKRKECNDKIILLVDDAVTTAATASALARLLYGAKAKKVYLLTVASVVLQKQNFSQNV